MHRPTFELYNNDYCLSQLVPTMAAGHTGRQTPPTEQKQQKDTFLTSVSAIVVGDLVG